MRFATITDFYRSMDFFSKSNTFILTYVLHIPFRYISLCHMYGWARLYFIKVRLNCTKPEATQCATFNEYFPETFACL